MLRAILRDKVSELLTTTTDAWQRVRRLMQQRNEADDLRGAHQIVERLEAYLVAREKAYVARPAGPKDDPEYFAAVAAGGKEWSKLYDKDPKLVEEKNSNHFGPVPELYRRRVAAADHARALLETSIAIGLSSK